MLEPIRRRAAGFSGQDRGFSGERDDGVACRPANAPTMPFSCALHEPAGAGRAECGRNAPRHGGTNTEPFAGPGVSGRAGGLAQRALNNHSMNLNHAFGFLLVGTVFGLLPRFAPGWCPPTGVDGTSAREIWLQLMSALLIGVAVSHLARRTLAVIVSLLEYDPQRRRAGAQFDGAVGHEALVLNKAAIRAARPRLPKLLPVPVNAFQAGLLEQRPAA